MSALGLHVYVAYYVSSWSSLYLPVTMRTYACWHFQSALSFIGATDVAPSRPCSLHLPTGGPPLISLDESISESKAWIVIRSLGWQRMSDPGVLDTLARRSALILQCVLFQCAERLQYS